MNGKWFGSAVLRCLTLFTASALVLVASIALGQPNERALERVLALQNRNSVELMAVKGVVGTGTGLAPDGLPAVIVYSTGKGTGPIPRAYGEVPVIVHVTGEIFALKKPAPVPTVDPTVRFDVPVPIGVSTGNEFYYGVGTIGCRLARPMGDEVFLYYALSNHHVFDPYDTADFDWSLFWDLPQRVVQPGRGDDPTDDLAGTATQENLLGGIAASVPIDYGGASNSVDASIAKVPIPVTIDGKEHETRTLGTSTPEGGYGSPKLCSTVPAEVGMIVQKYGRTTQLTKGVVQAINVTVEINYSMFGVISTATFTGQITVTVNRGAFAKPGDSGSLIVTDGPDPTAVGLLFAGNANGRTGFANPIDVVLNELGADLAVREGLQEPVELFVDGE